MLLYSLLGHLGVVLAAIWIAAAGAKLLLGSDRHEAPPSQELSVARLRALFRHLYREDFAILMTLVVTTAGLVTKYGGWIPGMENQFFFESINVLAVLYAVLTYHVEDL